MEAISAPDFRYGMEAERLAETTEEIVVDRMGDFRVNPATSVPNGSVPECRGLRDLVVPAFPDRELIEVRGVPERMVFPFFGGIISEKQASPKYDVPTAFRIDFLGDALKTSIKEDIVGVEEAEDFTSCLFKPAIEGVGLSPIGFYVEFEEFRVLPNEGFCNFHRIVRRFSILDNHFKMGVVLIDEALKCFLQKSSLIKRGSDDGDFRQLIHSHDATQRFGYRKNSERRETVE